MARRRRVVTALVLGTGLVLALGVVAVVVTGTGRPRHAAPARDPPLVLSPNGTVVQVIDGDTIVARVDGGDEHVRLIGIDTSK